MTSSNMVVSGQDSRCHSGIAASGLCANLNSIAAPMRPSLTYDQGKEMTRHTELAAQPCCDRHSPWQRGTP